MVHLVKRPHSVMELGRGLGGGGEDGWTSINIPKTKVFKP